MHCVLVADLAAIVSQYGQAIACGHDAIPPEAVSQYWSTSRNRVELWNQVLFRYRQCEKSGDSICMRRWWEDHVVVMEEIFVTEMLTRVVASLADHLDQKHQSDEVAPVAHSVFLNHLEVRNRVQQIMLFGRGHRVEDVVRLNRLRQGVERWTDALVGRMASHQPRRIRYAMTQSRAQQYADEYRAAGFGPVQRTSAWLINAAMHDTLHRRTSPRAALGQANRAVAASVLLMLRPDLFDSVGILKSLWLHRLQSGIHHAEQVIDDIDDQTIDQDQLVEQLHLNQSNLGRMNLGQE